MKGRIVRGEPQQRLPFPIVGKVKIGYKDELGMPHSADWFIPSGKYEGLFAKAFGEKPQTIRVVFPSDDPSLCCNEFYEYRDDGGKLVASGDGEMFKVWNGREYGEYSTEEHPGLMEGVAKKWGGKTGWKVTLTLNFFLPEVQGVMGVWQFRTKGSLSTIPSVRDAFDAMLESNGKVAGVIFDLSVKFAKSQKPGQKSRFPVVSLTANESRENIERVVEARREGEKQKNLLLSE